MIIKCLSLSGYALPSDYLDPPAGFDRETLFALTLHKNYVVFALTIRNRGVWYYLIDDRNLAYPVWHPAPLFEVIDNRLSRYWVFGFNRLSVRDGDTILAFPEWADDPLGYYDRLSDGDADEIELFERYRSLMTQEFALKDETGTAEDLGDGWLMCPNCREAWHTTAVGERLICPRCESPLRNPRIDGM